MPELTIDRRDLDFVLYEQFKLDEFTKMERYNEMGREMWDMVLSEAIKFAVEQIAPMNPIADREGTKLNDGVVKVPDCFAPVYEKFTEGGWTATSQDPELGGMGLPIPLGIAVTEGFIAACSSFMFIPGLTVSAGHLLESYGTEKLRELLVPKMYSGEWAGTMCLTEPQAGTAVGEVRTTATPIEGTDLYKISGNKIFISAGDQQLTENIIHLVLARVPGDAPGTKGISLFAVPKYRFDDNGGIGEANDVAVTAIEHKMGIHASPTCSLAFGDNDGCEGYLIGERQQGIIYMFQMMNEARIVCGIQGSASANASYQLALAYAKERIQGSSLKGRDGASVPIIEHPDVRRNLMLCKTYSEGIRALLIQSAVNADLALHHTDKETRSNAEMMLDLLTPICKAYATDIGFKVTELAMQVHGGYGYVGEYAVEQYMRDVKIASIYEGTNGVQALDLVGRKMRLKGGSLFLLWLQDINEVLQRHAEHPRLATQVAAVDKGKNALAESAFGFSEKGKQDIDLAMVGATPFLEMFGHVQVARLLLDQAIIADAKLEEIYADKGATDDETKRQLVADNDEVRFYDGKVKGAKFFISTVLPHARAIASELKVADTSALDIVL